MFFIYKKKYLHLKTFIVLLNHTGNTGKLVLKRRHGNGRKRNGTFNCRFAKVVARNELQMEKVDYDQSQAEELETFEYNGVEIYNPFQDESGRFLVSPIEYYGLRNIKKIIGSDAEKKLYREVDNVCKERGWEIDQDDFEDLIQTLLEQIEYTFQIDTEEDEVTDNMVTDVVSLWEDLELFKGILGLE